MTPGWDWSQIITIAVVIGLIWAVVQISKAIGKIIMTLAAVFVGVYLGQSLGWWHPLPFDCPSPMDLWAIAWPIIQDWLSHSNR
ncbi:MAG: hypothetical protein LBV00_12290 [Propionibacteriaceae bacterium]|jgi:hypothetical protein|nr:hypothetical protein [Propionibacteriaceae bacterium]